MNSLSTNTLENITAKDSCLDYYNRIRHHLPIKLENHHLFLPALVNKSSTVSTTFNMDSSNSDRCGRLLTPSSISRTCQSIPPCPGEQICPYSRGTFSLVNRPSTSSHSVDWCCMKEKRRVHSSSTNVWQFQPLTACRWRRRGLTDTPISEASPGDGHGIRNSSNLYWHYKNTW